jgi:hypothetical protein
MDTLKETDIDLNYSAEEISGKVEEEMNMQPKAATKTSSFYVMIATILAGIIVTLLISSGIITEDQSETVKAGLTVVIGGGIAYIVGKYIDGRSKVSQIKAEAAMAMAIEEKRAARLNQELSRSTPAQEPLSAFNVLATLPMVLNLALLALGNTTKGKKGKVVKAIKAVLAALNELS